MIKTKTNSKKDSKKKTHSYKFIIIMIVIIIILLMIYLNVTSHGLSEETLKLLPTEVREYEGENLSSITDFRENSIKGPQYVDTNNYTLKIQGLVEEPKTISYEDVISEQKYEKVVTLYCVEGWQATILWEGFLLKDLIAKAQAKPEANTVIFHAYDGYTSSLPLDYVLENNIILAHKMNGLTLPPERGYPFQVVAESKWGYKWVKWVTKIELTNNPYYKGFWEKRGYSTSADLNENFFE